MTSYMTYMRSKCAFIVVMTNKSLCAKMNKKSSNFVKKNGLNFKLKHRNAQKSILSGRFGALTGRSGDLMKNLETPGKTGSVGRYVFTKAFVGEKI